MRGAGLLSGGLLIAVAACTSSHSQAASQQTENKMTDASPPLPMADRPPPPAVAPVVRDGIRYAPKVGTSHDPQVGGLLAAYDDKTGKELWTLPVFRNTRDIPGMEGDVQDVFFKSMAFAPDGKLLIVDENDRRYAVDVAARTSTPLP